MTQQLTESSPSEISPDVLDDLASASDASYHKALGQIPSAGNIAGAVGVTLVVNVVERLVARGVLTDRQQADRVHGILRRIRLGENALSDLARRAREFPAGARNAVAGILSPAQRQLLLIRTKSAQEGLPSTEPAPLSGAESAKDSEGLAEAPESVDEVDQRDDKKAKNAFTTVALLSGPFPDANKRLLSKYEFGPVVLNSLEKLEQDLKSNSDVCACLVDGSVLQSLDEDGQLKLFELLGSYSTFLWIRVEETHLKLSLEKVRDCLRRTRYLREDIPARLLSIQPDGNLREREIGEVAAASQALLAHAGAEFVPGELSASEANLLMAAAQLHARELQIDGRVEVQSLETRFLPRARSGARVAILRVNEAGRPIVAKIDKKGSILDEMARFRTFIESSDDELRPKLHFHADAATILFGLVSRDEDRSQPAEVLEERLEALWNLQLFGRESGIESVRDGLTQGVQSAVRRLGALNSRPAPKSPLGALGNPSVGVFEKLESSGIDWGLGEVAVVARKKAIERFKRLENAAIIHGDVHLQNILLRADRDAHLIDYAASGPGHPAVDLVRLELALFLGALRQVESESRCIIYQNALTIEKASYTTLEKNFPLMHKCHLNVVCSQGCVAARDHALAVLDRFGGGLADYQAAKYLVAWQNLAMMGRHTGLARATIEALAPEIAAW